MLFTFATTTLREMLKKMFKSVIKRPHECVKWNGYHMMDIISHKYFVRPEFQSKICLDFSSLFLCVMKTNVWAFFNGPPVKDNMNKNNVLLEKSQWSACKKCSQ